MTQTYIHRIRWVIWGGTLCFVVALAMAALTLVQNTRKQALEESQEQLARYLSGAEAAINRSLLGVDVLLAGSGTAPGLANPGKDPAAWASAMSASLQRTAQMSLTVRLLALVNEQGQVLASSDPRGPDMDLRLPDGFVARVLSPPVSELMVSPAVRSFASSEMVLYVGRHVSAPGGGEMVALAEVPVGALGAVLTQGAEITGLEAALETGSGGMLLAVPDIADDADARTQLEPLGAVLKQGVGWKTSTRLRQLPGLVLGRHLLYDDLWVSASLPREAALADWRGDAKAIGVVTGVFALVLLTAGALFTRYLQRMTRARQLLVQSKLRLDKHWSPW